MKYKFHFKSKVFDVILFQNLLKITLIQMLMSARVTNTNVI